MRERVGSNPPTNTKMPSFPKVSRMRNSEHVNTIMERGIVLQQAIRLAIRHINKRSGLTDKELKEYLETILKVY